MQGQSRVSQTLFCIGIGDINVGERTKVIRQNTCLTAVGSDFLGLAVSAAAIPTNSVPEKAKAALTNTSHKPLNPWANAPGISQYLPPRYVPFGPPAIFKIIPRMLRHGSVMRHDDDGVDGVFWKIDAHMNDRTAVTFTMEKTNSPSPYPLTPTILREMIKIQKTATQMAVGMLDSQYSSVKVAATISNGRTMSHCRA